MKPLILSTALLAACLTAGAADEKEKEAKKTTSDATRALLIEAAKTAKPVPQPSIAAKSDKAEPPPAPATTAPVAAKTPSPTDPAAKTAQEPASVLPQVEVNKTRITELDREIHEQNKDIAREQKNTKPTELDKALNSTKVSNALSVLGGQSADYRANLAKERVSLMEEERDILEQMKLAKTKEDKATLQKELDEIKTLRRDLEKNLR